MTREEIIGLAREAGLHMYINDVTEEPYALCLERFAALVAAAEREACAKLIDEQDSYGDPVYGWFRHLAAKIRARGQE